MEVKKWPTIKLEESVNIRGEMGFGRDFEFVACADCGALVPNLKSTRDLHTEWHERLRRAVDETGTLS